MRKTPTHAAKVPTIARGGLSGPCGYGTGVDVVMVGNLAHHGVYNEGTLAIAETGHHRQRFAHEGALEIARDGAMLAQHGHRRVTRIAVQNRESERKHEAAILLRILAKFAKFAGHGRRVRKIGQKNKALVGLHNAHERRMRLRKFNTAAS
jgi:hypothetical protein